MSACHLTGLALRVQPGDDDDDQDDQDDDGDDQDGDGDDIDIMILQQGYLTKDEFRTQLLWLFS